MTLRLMQVALLLSIGDGEEPPTEFRILSKGENKTTKGPVLFDDASAKLVPQAYAKHGADLMVDYEHKSLLSTPAVDGGKAAGWFKPEVRNGELWATDVKWTPAADAALRAREYRYFSPAVLRDSNGRVHKLINVALTNLPATENLRALVASELPITPEKHMEPTETELALFNALETDSLSKALGVIAALKEEKTKVVTLSVKNAELTTSLAARDVDKLLLDAKEAGKITDAELPKLREQGIKDVEWLSSYLSVKTVAPAAQQEHKEAKKDASSTTLNAAELKICKLSGISHEDFLKEKQRLAALNEQPAEQESN